MTYDSGLAHRIRNTLPDHLQFTEQEMFGGLGFLNDGNMCCGVIDDKLIARVGPEQYGDALDEPHASVFDYTGRPMRGWVFVDQTGLGSKDALDEWLERRLTFVGTLPPK